MKYAHAANVKSFQGGAQNAQYVGVQDGSFWAIFDVCTLDVQGSALGSGFPYNAGKFYVASGPGNYGPSNPGNVNAGGVALSSQSPQVLSAVHSSFALSPTPQTFPKQFYPNLRYRIAVFVKEWPAGYRGEPMTLRYDGQPQITAVVQDVTPENPAFVPFYNSLGGPGIVGKCP